MQEVVFLIQEAPEGGYTARALGHSIFTEAENWDELREAVRDSVRCHFDPIDFPRVIRLHYVRDEVLVA
ncbi:MAG: 2-oxoisovalerate dehydrogenase [Acidobacteria bacterium]|nr:2-oxoisovalerate dehydrogenase [Acidobacteriota bacterium]